MNNFCHQCGKKLLIDAKFCGACGTPVAKAEDASPAVSTSTDVNRVVADWPGLGATLGGCNLIPGLTIFFLTESEAVELQWESNTIDMLLTDYGVVFSPSPDHSSFTKAALKVHKYGGIAGMALGSGFVGALVGGVIGGGVAAVAGLASKAKSSASSSKANELQERFALGQAILCRKQDIKVFVFAEKATRSPAQDNLVIEGLVQFPHVGKRQALIFVHRNEFSNPHKVLISVGYLKKSDFRNCTEMDRVSYIRAKYSYPRATTYEENIASLEETRQQMIREYRNKGKPVK